MLYLWLKYIHIISSTILFGTGIGTASVMLYGHFKKNIEAMAVINEYVVIVDWLFTGTSAVAQFITGFLMAYIVGYSFKSLWIMGGIIGYFIAAACWIPVVILQMKIRDITVDSAQKKTILPPLYYRYFKYWFWLGWPAFISLLVVFYLMVAKPY